MSQQLVIDGFAFARDGRVHEGVLPISGLERLHNLLTETSGEFYYRLQGLKGEHGLRQLMLTVSGSVLLECQRCLGVIRFDVDVESVLELLPEGAEMSQDELEDDSRDYLPVAEGLDVIELVEDEILLALPVAPRHDNCVLPGAAEVGEWVSPFTELGLLKGKSN